MPQLTCQTCGKVFHRVASKVPASGNYFCSNECCQNKPIKKRLDLTCARCGKVFRRYPSLSPNNKQYFCSRKCIQSRIEMECVICGKAISRKASHANRVPNPTCSTACHGKWHAQVMDTGPRLERIILSCAACGKVIQRLVCQITGNRAYCNRTCAGIGASLYQSGENNPNWCGGTHGQYYGPNWPTQRKAARQRDKCRCQVCGITQRKLKRQLDVHHIQPFRTFGYIAGENERYKDANQLTNLISLCPSCHKLVEYGKASIQLRLV